MPQTGAILGSAARLSRARFDGGLAVSAGRDGDLLVRVDPSEYRELLSAGGQPAYMGHDRPMGEGWMNVPMDVIADNEALAWWIAVGRTSRSS